MVMVGLGLVVVVVVKLLGDFVFGHKYGIYKKTKLDWIFEHSDWTPITESFKLTLSSMEYPQVVIVILGMRVAVPSSFVLLSV